MNPIDSLFQELRSKKRPAFMPFITAGDPDLETTSQLIQEFGRRGANLIEVGFPYSDPIADGSVIQASYTRALEKGIRIDDIFACLSALKDSSVPLLVAMVSFSLVYRRGPEKFLDSAQAAGLCGAIVPDLPLDETEALCKAAADRDFKIILLVTPTTPTERAAQIARTSTGFLYCVSVTGITGERDKLPEALLDQLQFLRSQTDLPLCVGFGISKPEHVEMLKGHADGVIVGSAIVRQLQASETKPVAEVIEQIGDYIENLLGPLN